MSDAVTQMQQTIGVRAAEDISEFGQCVELQQAIWGYSTLNVVPDQMFIVAKKTGGHALLAFDREKPVGFALAFVGRRDGRSYLHSHMVSVLEKYRDRGVGRLLKLAQRKDALARGFELIEWTFDPLQLKNAKFNITRLGAVVRHYIPNLYGRTTSPLHGGLPTDRLVAEWWVRSSRAENAVKDLPQLTIGGSVERISVPADIRTLCETQPEMAAKIQSYARVRFERLIAEGYAATGFDLNKTEGTYLLEPYED